jgi:predicted RNase H-like HicB family nuclease
MTKYEIILYWSEEDQAFIAEVPELAGCSADGSTRQEALANAETVIAEWIETARNSVARSRNRKAVSCQRNALRANPTHPSLPLSVMIVVQQTVRVVFDAAWRFFQRLVRRLHHARRHRPRLSQNLRIVHNRLPHQVIVGVEP